MAYERLKTRNSKGKSFKDILEKSIGDYNITAQSFEKDYTGDYLQSWRNSDEITSYYDRLSDLNDKTKSLRIYINRYGTDEQKATLGDIDKALEGYSGVLSGKDSVIKQYGNFQSADEYNAAVKAYQDEQNFINNYDLEGGNKRLSELDSLIAQLRQKKASSYREGTRSAQDNKNYQKQIEELVSEREALAGDIRKVEKARAKEGYYSLVNNTDFGDISAQDFKALEGQSGIDNIRSGNHSSLINITSKLDPSSEYYYMTDEERQIFNYLNNTEGVDSARKFLDTIQGDLVSRQAGKAFEFAKDNPFNAFLGSLISIPTQIMSGVDFVTNIGTERQSTNANIASSLRAGVSERIDNPVGEFFYNTTMSGVDSVLAALLPGGAGAGMLALSAASQSSNDILSRGGTAGQAAIGGIASGIFEAFFERYSIANLKSMDLKKITTSWKDFIGNMGKQMITNAAEEGLTEIANITFDTMAMGDISNYIQTVEQYMSEGMSESDARWKAAGNFGLQIAESAASGALMGLGFGTGGAAIGVVQRAVEGKKVINANTKKGEMTLDELITASDGLFNGEYADNAKYDDARTLLESVKENLSKKDTAQANRIAKLEELYMSEANKKSPTWAEQKKAIAEAAVEDVSETVKQAESAARAVTVNRDFADVKYSSPLKIADYGGMTADKITVETRNGERVTLDSLSLEDAELGELYSLATTLGSVEAANSFIENWDGQTEPSVYWAEWQKFENRGQLYPAEYEQTSKDLSTSFLSEVQRLAAFRSGVSLYEREISDRKAKISKAVEQYKKGASERTEAKFDGKEAKAKWDKLNKTQREYYNFLKVVSEALGVNVRVFVSEKGSRKDTENGSYDRSTNTLSIDLNAGMDDRSNFEAVKSCLLYTVSHESLHAMAVNNSEKYAVLRDTALKLLAEKEGHEWVEERIAARMEELGEEELKDPVEARKKAIEEVVARACEDMFATSRKIQELFERVARENESVAKTFLDTVKNVIKRIGKLFKSFADRDVRSRSEEALSVSEMSAEAISEIQRLFEDGILSGIEASRAHSAVAENMDSDWVMLQTRNDITQSESKQLIKILNENIDKVSQENKFDVHFDGVVPGVKSDFVNKVFETQNGKATNPVLGDVLLSNKGAKSTIFHGYGKNKLVATYAIKDTVEKGNIVSSVNNYDNSGKDRYIIAAKGLLNDGEAYVAVVVEGYPNNGGHKQFYLHEVMIKETAPHIMTATHDNADTVSGTVSNNSITDSEQNVNTNSEKMYQKRGGVTKDGILSGIEASKAHSAVAQEKTSDWVMLQTRDDITNENNRTNKSKNVKYDYSKAFEENDTDLEKKLYDNAHKVIDMKNVSELSGEEFSSDGQTSLKDRVVKFFNSFDNSVDSKELGTVKVNLSSFRDDKGHGLTYNKVVSFAAIPEVVRDGKVIDVWKPDGKPYQRITLAAPISIAGEKYYMGVMIQKDRQSQRMYLHDVITEKATLSFTTEPTAENSEGIRDKSHLFITSILQNALNVNRFSKKDYAISKDFEKDTLYQKRSQTQSNREVLANALMSTARTPEEKGKLSAYKDKIKEIEGYEDRLKEIEGETYYINHLGDIGERDRERLKSLREEREGLEAKLKRADSRLLQIESAKPLRELLAREIRRNVRKTAKEVGDRAREASRQRTENMQKAQYVERITKKAKQMRDTLIKNSPKKHVPDAIKEPIAKLLDSIDFSSKQLLRTDEPTLKDISMSRAMRDVGRMLAGIREGTIRLDGYLDLPDGFSEAFSELAGRVSEIAEEFGTKNVLNEMSLEELKLLNEVLYTINRSITQANSLISNARYKHASEAAVESIQHFNTLSQDKSGAIKDFLDFKNMLPYYYFKRLGNSAFSMFESVMDGQDKFAFLTKQIMDFTEKTYTEEQIKEWKDTVKEFRVNGVDVKMTVTQIMSLYLLSKRAQAKNHLLGGGAVIRTADKRLAKRMMNLPSGFNLTEADIVRITSTLTNEQLRVARALQKFMSEVGGRWGNEISMARFGIKMFGDPDYMPIEVDTHTLNKTEAESTVVGKTAKKASLYRLLNMSATRQLTPHANNRVVIRDLFDVFAEHMTDMAMYNSFALPILDMIKWYNYKYKTAADIDISGDTNIITIEADSELAKRIENSDKSKYNVIRDYLIEKFGGQKFTLSDGKKAIMDKRDAQELSHKANTARIAQLGNLKSIVENALYDHSEMNVEHNKFSAFHYYAIDVKYDKETFKLWINVGEAKNDGVNHIYAITNRKEEAPTNYGVSRPVGNAIQNASSTDSIYQKSKIVNSQSKNNFDDGAVTQFSSVELSEKVNTAKEKFVFSSDFEKNTTEHFGVTKLGDYVHVQQRVRQSLPKSFFSPVTNSQTGMIVNITPKGINETFNYETYHKLPKALKLAKLASVEMIPEAIEKGTVRIDNQNNYHDVNSPISYAYIYYDTVLDGQPCTLKIDVRKSDQSNSNRLHVHSVELTNKKSMTHLREHSTQSESRQHLSSTEELYHNSDGMSSGLNEIVNSQSENNFDDGAFTQFSSVELSTALERTFGQGALKYWEDFMVDLNSAQDIGRGEEFSKKMMSNYKVAKVAFNLRVAILQPTAYIRAGNVLNGFDMTKAALNPQMIKRGIRQAEKWCGIALWKSMGYYDINIANSVADKIKHDESIRDKAIDVSLKLAEWGDKITWGALWNACEREVSRRTPELVYDSDEYNRAVAKRLREVIYSTQVVDSVLTRSDIMRSKGALTQMGTAFMSEPTVTYNIIQSAAQDIRDAKRRGERIIRKATLKRLARPVCVFVIGAVVTSIVQSLPDAVRDDDDEEFGEKYLEALLSNALSEFNLLDNIPFVKEGLPILYELLNTVFDTDIAIYDSTRMDTAFIEAYTKAIRKIGGWIFDDKYDAVQAAYALLDAVSQSTGFAVSNLLRDIVAIWNSTIGEIDEDLKIKLK